MRKKVDINSWNRKDHYHFFSKFTEPFYGITADVECDFAYHQAKTNKQSFFLTYIHKALQVANDIQAFRYRIIDDVLYEYEMIDASPTINREDGTFGFSYLKFHQNFETFQLESKKEIEIIKASKRLFPKETSENVIHFSALPWIKFTSLSHARHYDITDSCPKISFGKLFEKDNKLHFPVSVHVHHALVDGRDVGLFFENFEKLMSSKN